uniref:ATP synthase F0 subunit 8 n=1 Tax=Metoecus javanus TaxID=2873716 RepID=UPI001E6D6D4B|nr:ATP synthase F0 subunit 8 [Metoecus javanus]QZQ53002.1 ATP synthase F0 subunit 8 [Metoecus cf. javanus JL-2021a]UOI84444.1 ATP synthase F0 subunit 8 [Metoecus javanus]UOI84457.1 ATP synthase F0 subunit 8 [Metoecus javanus]UOI84470.1 ATP synthase F0 subunit 8 [Metoecus javanus]
MPQMAPLNWLTLMFFFLIVFTFFLIINYYTIMYMQKKKFNKTQMTFMNWKW